MMTRWMFVFSLIAVAARSAQSTPSTQSVKKGGYIVQHDADVAKQEPGTHNGGGQTVGYSFFDKTPNMHFVFRKRALKPGSGIGYHEQHEDEVYYVLSGRGVMTLDDKPTDVGPGTAILTRPGSSHGLKQTGNEDLVVLIAYEIK
jgi:mannose-6-phosphate isomerase-like protein (cupin superfamily)